MKVIKQLLLAIVLLLSSTAVNAQDFKVDGIYYDFTSETTVGVSFDANSLFGGGNKYKGDIVIPSQVTYEGKTYDVTSIISRAFNSCPELTGVTIPNSVTDIGIIAFKNSKNLTSITIPESVTSIGTQAFNGCQALKEIKGTFSGVTEIGANAFDKTEWFNDQPDGMVYLGKSLYCYKGELSADTTIVIKEGTKCIASNAFAPSRTTSEYIIAVKLPESVAGIGDNAFKECISLKSIVIPDSVKKIADYAFMNCYSLEEITMGEGITSIGKYAFQECSSLKEIIIPDKVESIGDCAFIECISIESATLSSSLANIGKQAFYNCFCLENITISNGNISIGENAFHNTAWYDSKPAGVLYIGNMLYTYKGDMPENTHIAVKEGTKSTAANAFAGCTNLKGITFPKTVECIESYSFKGCTALSEVKLSENLKSIGMYAFDGCTALSELTFPEKLKSIEKYAFNGCSAIVSITLPDNLETLGMYAFHNCSSLENVVIGKNLKNIKDYSFKGCSNLVNLTISEGVETIDSYAFQSCGNILEITIPNSVVEIGHNAFQDCRQLTKLVIGSGVKTVGSYALYETNFIESIYMMCETPPELESGLYSNDIHYSTPVLYVPKGTVEAYRAQEIWGRFKNIEEHSLTDISNVEDDKVAIEVNAGAIVVSNAVGKSVSVYDVLGKLVEKFNAYSGEEILLGKGIYIVRVGNNTMKVKL